jgi:hypothetical protein
MQINGTKLAAASFIGILFGLQVHHDLAKWGALGLDSFLKYQTSRFSREMNPVQPLLWTLIASILVALFAMGVYEVLVLLISKLTKLGQRPATKT